MTASKVISIVREPMFDAVHGTDTATRVQVHDTDASGPNVAYAVDYEPTSYHEARALFQRLRLTDVHGAFVDFGCGKGRMLLLATEYSFGRIVGIEFSQQLCDTARANVQKYCSSTEERVEILNEDAASYELSDDEVVFFFFNPFAEAVMSMVLESIYRSLRRRNRQVWVIYNNPRCRALFESGGVFLKVDEHRLPRTRAFVYTNVGTDPRSVRSLLPERRADVPGAGEATERVGADGCTPVRSSSSGR
ncbi:class I SAM-dependent methyltransferase [Actinomycetospora rhizophila]|uniref:Class I SAM-dependent methyltransferase n=1 Tax=Actinomycetospora rhizophila TaxID=1416876 RepID=A0ABV9Z5E9_9PSEU